MSRISPALAPTAALVALALASGGLHGMETMGSAAVSAGSMDSDSGLNFEGTYAIILGGGFGFQIDGLHSSIGSTEFTGGGAQVFWQNDSPFLASLGYSRVHGEFVDSDEFSAGLQFQQSWYSIGTKIGFAQIDYAVQVPFIDDKDNGLLIEIYADFYASDTLRASLGVEHRFDLFFAKAEVEWLTPIDGLSLFANCMVGQNQYDHALVGLRYYFGGESGSLKGRRKTPRAMSSGVLFATGNHGALYNSRGKKFLAANQGFGFSGSGHSGGTVTYGGTMSYNNAGTITILPIGYGGIGKIGGGNLVINANTLIGSSSLTASLNGGTLTIGSGSLLGPGSSPGSLNLQNITISSGTVLHAASQPGVTFNLTGNFPTLSLQSPFDFIQTDSTPLLQNW
jgi:hypothetical protein